mgnify:CR=1 FL=1
MFEENKNNIDEFDLSFRSVLEEAQEQVPAHVWDGIEGELDRISQRRVAVLWFRRAAVGAAAAAAVTLGMFFGRGTDAELVAPASDSSMIAVAETPAEVLKDTPEEAVGKLMAMVEKTSVGKTPAGKAETGMTEKAEAAETAETETVATESVATEFVAAGETRQEHESSAKPETDRATAKNDAAGGRFPDVWPEDRPQRKKTGTSIVISGITGTNSAQNSHRVNPMKRPAVSAAPKKTGIKEGAIVGGFTGLLMDIFFSTMIGFYTLLYLAIGFLFGRSQKNFYRENYILPVIFCAVSTVLFQAVLYITGFLFRGEGNIFYFLFSMLGPELVYTAVVTVLLYRILFGINEWLELKEKYKYRLF